MWSSTVGLVNGKHRYLTAETFGFKVNSNGQQLKRRQQWTIEPFPENTGPDGSISSAASVSSSAQFGSVGSTVNISQMGCQVQQNLSSSLCEDPAGGAPTCIMTLSNGSHNAGFSLRQSTGSNNGSDHSENCDEEHENVAIKSHLNKYLAVDSFGNVTCDSEEKTENARFTITICSMSQGKSKEEHIFWAFKNVERGYYLGTTEDGMICCNAKMPRSRAELWHLHLLPARGASFFALKSLGRKRFARVCSEESIDINQKHRETTCQVQLDANISWGAETLFQFKYFEGGRYALLTSDNRFLTNEGRCVPQVDSSDGQPPSECLFTIEYHSGYLAFRDSFGQYLAATGRSSILRSRSIGVSRDELFMFEGVPIQVSMKATFNNRWVSIKQGVDVLANQTETTSKYETFQMIFHKQTQLWSIMTQECNFWTISKNTNTVSVCRPADYEALTRGQFKLIWSENEATFHLRYIEHSIQTTNSERLILARKSGQLYLSGAPVAGHHQAANQQPVKFIMRFQNRRLLNLRPVEGNGFVGLKSLSSGSSAVSRQLEANKTSPDSIKLEYSDVDIQTSQALESNGQFCSGNNSLVESESNNSRVISVFNIKLNSTKDGQNILANLNQTQETTIAKSNHQETGLSQSQHNKHSECLMLDSNNNDQTDNMTIDGQQLQNNLNGGVESCSAPSVASIINTFSNSVRIGDEQQTHKAQVGGAPVVSSVVSKLASSFEASKMKDQQKQEQASSEIVQSNISEHSDGVVKNSSDRTSMNGEKLADQVAQFECCYMKIITSGKYLVVRPTNSVEISANSLASHNNTNGDSLNQSVSCEATNRACAQSWILELRSHNSIAIRASDTQAYMQLGTNGTIYLSHCEPKQASLWEF